MKISIPFGTLIYIETDTGKIVKQVSCWIMLLQLHVAGFRKVRVAVDVILIRGLCYR